ncbi:MAG: aminomethyl-transferring glycine dehydrogenase subunit GcvPA [Candidatus Eremiobacteraeota bacterium]|nr:aminomethyl-transferring glycine dehydrogenase subunit GcvPA [Candidatus Eremiobacteraeota bacterium]MBC5802181.1 aminomethyl-transferring glycine dehydrogenase subunit GcvPA [Candidatus Eremiobacteraeota bacterium]MBC5821556.1 aminomethyl-transferring glycine dehydrogenase subunit GcvPA [Candidatus Eremiobacteraeota bacterium]
MYAPHTDADIEAMLAAVGARSLDELVAVPQAVAIRSPLEIPAGLPELELYRRMSSYAARNGALDYTSFLGAGAYRHYAPPVIGTLAMRGEFLTAYTPYQAEVSQGYLQAIYEWQTDICLLTALDIANASVYDGATALAEGAIMAVNATGRRAILVSRAVHPNYRAVLHTYARGLELAIEELPVANDGTTDLANLEARLAEGRFAAVVVQNPNFFGAIDVPPDDARRVVEGSGSILIGVVAEAMSLGALVPPGKWGAQIAVGEAQSFGVPVAYGGPYVGFIAATKAHMRRIPGRLVGRTVDADGKTAYTLTLQAREQHIRREKATSNICTNQAHCALIATIYLACLGGSGLRRCATLNVERCATLVQRVTGIPGFTRAFSAAAFNETVIRVQRDATAAVVLAALREKRILGGVDLGRWYPELADCILMTATELTTDEEMTALCDALAHLAVGGHLVGA